MIRQPIITSQDTVDIKLVQPPLGIADMLPDYRYEFQSGNISDESAQMFNGLVEFIDVNNELILGESYSSRDDYVKGFQKAVAIVRLWIDSIYLDNNQGDE